MPKKNRFPVSPAKTLNSPVIKKNTPHPEKFNTQKKRYNKNSIMWLQEAYDSARGETALWVAVITQAIVDARSRCKKSESIYQKDEAIRWLTNNSKDFVDVCLAAGMNPEYVKRKAKQAISSAANWRAEPGKGKRYEERKEYRRKQLLKETEQKPIDDSQLKVISIC